MRQESWAAAGLESKTPSTGEKVRDHGKQI